MSVADFQVACCSRFSAKHREYKYFIVQDGTLDMEAMEKAAQYLVGTHDFRNFCKADVQQVRCS
jgi:tRNA pseudouridine38/39 synthase